MKYKMRLHIKNKNKEVRKLQGIELKISYLSAIFGGLGGFLFGKWDLPLKILLAGMVLDYISGMLKAFYFREVSSRIGYKGLIKKTGILFTIVVANLTDTILGLTMFRSAICMFFCVNEFISVLENVSVIGVPIPDIFKDRLIQVRKNIVTDNNKDNIDKKH